MSAIETGMSFHHYITEVTCEECQGWGVVPLTAQEQLSTIPPGCTLNYCVHA